MNKSVLMIATFGLSLGSSLMQPAGFFGLSTPAQAAPAMDGAVPLPFARPDEPAIPTPMRGAASGSGSGGVPMPTPAPNGPARITPAAMTVPDITGSIPRINPMSEATSLKTGLDALSDRDAATAMSVRDSLPRGSLDRQIMTWAIATSGLRDVPSGEIAAAQIELKGWPGLSSLRALSERALYRENPPSGAVLAAFGQTRPETTEGTVILSRALVATGRSADAARLLKGLWVSQPLDKDMEDKILGEFQPLFSVADHKARMDMLMYRGRTAQAKRFSELGRAQSLYKAWTAVASGAKTAPAALASVDGSLTSDPTYLFSRIEYLRRQDKFREASALLEKAPRDPARLVNTGEWWNEQRIIARGLADQGDFRLAYKTISHPLATSSTDKVDADFHAGWYALRALNDPVTAEKHFREILDVSTKPLSASRAYYWLGRAAEAGGPGNAREFYTKAAHFSGTFYGQLAATRLGIRTLDVSYPTPTAQDRERFRSRGVMQAIERLDAAGYEKRAAPLYRALAEELTSPGELALLTARAEAEGDHALSLQMGKAAFSRGIDVAALAFPIGVIPANADINGSGKALAYAIARQESAFNPTVISAANARGLLQILPGTAQGVAKRHGISFKAERLTSDAAYNATLGAQYLGEQIDRFDGSYIMTFIAYNAGPRRVDEWIARYGDPRGKPIDEVVDWIERIPFPETRNYVQRVMENYQVYKTRLGQKADIEDDLRFGRR